MTLEYIITPAAVGLEVMEEYQWESTIIGIENPEPLAGFRVQTRVITPSMNPELPDGYPAWNLISQTVVCNLPDVGAQGYGGTPGPYAGGMFAEGGLMDGSGYNYSEVFTETEFYFLPQYSGKQFEEFTNEVEATNGFPTEPYDPDNGIYPMDTITKYSPDDRESVVVNYAVTTTYTIGLVPTVYTEVINIFHEIIQPDYNWKEQLDWLLDRTYFKHGFYH